MRNLTQHIEDDFQEDYVTGAVFMDITAAYDTINLKLLMQIVYATIEDINLPAESEVRSGASGRTKQMEKPEKRPFSRFIR